MKKFDEEERLKEVNSYNIENTFTEKEYDNIVFLASAICGTPIALVTLMYKERQWFKATLGTDLKENKRELSFCTHAIAGEEDVMVVENANEDIRFMHNPLVEGDPKLVFYAGAPIVNKNGYSFGTVCVYDIVKKTLTHEQKKGLKILSEQVMNLLELRKQNLGIEELNEGLQKKDRANFERLKNMIEIMPLAAKVLDENGRIVHANNLLYTFYNIDSAKTNLIGMSWQEFQDLVIDKVLDNNKYRTQNIFFHNYKEIVLGQEVRLVDGHILLKDYIPIFESDSFHGSLILYRDITQDRRTDSSKTEFISLASHQLRTPTTSINWYCELLLDEETGSLNQQQKEFLKEIHHGNQKMVELTKALLDVSQLETGEFFTEPKLINLDKIADDVLKELQTQIINKKLKIEKKYHAHGVEIETDPKLIRIVFQNLLSNAIFYTPEGGEISVEIKNHLGCAEIEICDNGPGIPINAQEKLFTKFFRAENAQVIRPDGTGLGLYIAKSILDKLGGHIIFDTMKVKGTSFKVSIPKK